MKTKSIKYIQKILPGRYILDKIPTGKVINSTGRFIDIQEGYSQGTVYEKILMACLYLKQWPVLPYIDKDGIQDAGEMKIRHGIKAPVDASLYSIHQSYKNRGIYINSFVQ